MSATVGYAEEDVGVVDQLLQVLDLAIGRGSKELRLQIFLDSMSSITSTGCLPIFSPAWASV